MAEQPTTRPVALITGASGGIGEALAYKVGGDGYRLVLVARNSEELNRVAGVIATKLDIPTLALPIDLSQADAIDTLDSELEKRGLVPDLVINNAGFGLRGAAAALDHDSQMNMIDLNIRALTELSLRCARAMKQRGHGGIINISSTAAYIPGPHMAVYYATKAFVSSFTEALAVELKPHGVQVTSVVPGVTKTDFQRRAGLEDALLVKAAPSMSPEQVAEIGYAGFKKGKKVVITGGLNWLTAHLFRVMPRRLLLPVLNRMQG
ncbi:MAG: SDR family NAD(P)-dependent oxidoreductase [Hyphomicrobiales bacterium]